MQLLPSPFAVKVRKDAPTVSDVHVDAVMGSGRARDPKKRKRRVDMASLALVKVAVSHDVSGEARDDHGEWTSGGGSGGSTSPQTPQRAPSAKSPAIVPITAAEARGNSRAVSAAEFNALATTGRQQLDAMAAAATPHVLTPALASHAFAACQASWGGATYDAHTGKELPQGAQRYAVTTKPPGMKTLAVPEDATEAQFAGVFKQALVRFGPELDKQNAHLGVFHDDDKHRIDIDPVTVVDSLEDVDTIGAASHAIGGAYCFADGNGYWPPHIAESGGAASMTSGVEGRTPALHLPLPVKKGDVAGHEFHGNQYLRIGDPPSNGRSANYVTGVPELGVSVYDLDGSGNPIAPPDDEDGETTLRMRLDSDDPKYLVTGEEAGVGHGGEPVLNNLKIVGEWHPPVKKSAEARPGQSFAQFRSQSTSDDDVDLITFDGEDEGGGDAENTTPTIPTIPIEPLKKAAHDVSAEARVTSGEGGGEWTSSGGGAGAPPTSSPGSARPIPITSPLPAHVLATLYGNAKVKGAEVNNFLADANGNSLRMSATDVKKIGQIRPGVPAPKTAIASAAGFDKAVHVLSDRLIGKANVKTHGIDTVPARFRTMAESAVARYTADPSLIQRDKFYEQWFNVTHALSTQTKIPQDRIAAAMANLSAGTLAAANLRFGTDLTNMVASNIPIPNDDGSNNPQKVLNGIFQRDTVLDAISNMATLKGGKGGAANTAIANDLNYAVDLIKSGKATTIGDLPSMAAAIFAHQYRKANGPQGEIPFDERMGDEYRKLTDNPGAGFGVSKGYLNYAKAVNVLRGYDVVKGADGEPTRVPFTPSDAVQQVKTRNFLNNIIDPNDAAGSDSVTVDYHAMNSGFGVLGGADSKTNSSQWNSGATVAGVQLGVRAHVADAIRAQVPYLRQAMHDPTLASSRAQEILWAEWKRGLHAPDPQWGGKGGKENVSTDTPAWVGYDGVSHPLLDMREVAPDRIKELQANHKKVKA